MAFQRPTLEEIATRVEADLTVRLGLVGIVLRRGMVVVLSRIIAGAVHLLHGHQEFLSRQLFPDTSEAEYLERQAGLFGIRRLAATYAAGTVAVAGINGSQIPAGTEMLRADGVSYTSDALGAVASGVATLAVTAKLAGVAGNADPGVVLSFVSPVSGVSPAATVNGLGILGGSDAEDDAALRARVLTRMSAPPQGGSAADYVTWAKEVPGVTRAWVYPLELGPGTVTVRFVRDGDAGLIPDAGEVAAVAAYIAERRPVAAQVTVLAPLSDQLDFVIHISPDTASARAAVAAGLEDLLFRDAAPGEDILVSQIRLAVGSAAGVADYVVVSPTSDVVYGVGELATMGSISWT